jgi:hypothetical protein
MLVSTMMQTVICVILKILWFFFFDQEVLGRVGHIRKYCPFITANYTGMGLT